MFGADDDFPLGIALSHADDVAATSFVDYFADFAVEAPVRQRLLLGGVDFYDNAGAWFVLVQELGQFRLAFLAERLLHEPAGSGTISF